MADLESRVACVEQLVSGHVESMFALRSTCDALLGDVQMLKKMTARQGNPLPAPNPNTSSLAPHLLGLQEESLDSISVNLVADSMSNDMANIPYRSTIPKMSNDMAKIHEQIEELRQNVSHLQQCSEYWNSFKDQQSAVENKQADRVTACEENLATTGRPETRGAVEGVLQTHRTDIEACAQTPHGRGNQQDQENVDEPITREDTDLETEVSRRGDLFFIPRPLRCLSHNVWEAAILIGLPGVTLTANVISALVVMFNIFVQAMFCVIIGREESVFMASPVLSVDSMFLWRSMAHEKSQVDPVTGASLVARVCGEDESLQVAGEQLSLVVDANAYLSSLNGLKQGPTLFALSWLLWFLCVCGEGCEISDFIISLLPLPGRRTRLVFKAGSCRFQSLSWRRFVYMLLLTGMRLAVCSALFIYGALWLANTLNIENLVLNAAALGFIMDLDEMLYLAMPSMMHTFLEAIEPLALPEINHNTCFGRFHVNIGVRPLVFAMIGVGVFTWIYRTKIINNQEDLQEALDILCGGAHDFVWNRGSTTGMLLSAPTPTYDPSYQNSQKIVEMGRQLVQTGDVVTIPPNATASNWPFLAYYFQNVAQFRFYSETAIEEMTYSPGAGSLSCNSLVRAYPVFLLEGLRQQSGISNGSKCEDFMSQCGIKDAPFLRSICPTQCGCGSVHSGLYLSGDAMGCPRDSCRRFVPYVESLASVNCDLEPNPSALNSSSSIIGRGWIRFWEEFASTDTGFFDVQGRNASEWSNDALRRGCHVLSDFDIYAHFCFETAQVGSAAAYCPITCGCRRNPERPDCPPSCHNFSATFQHLTQTLPCCDIDAPGVNISMWASWGVAAGHYFEKFIIPAGRVFSNLTLDAWRNVVRTQGCATWANAATPYCNPDLGPYDITSICPRSCACNSTFQRLPSCPGTCSNSNAKC